MTAKFVSAAELMARVLGVDTYRFAVIDHPISSASTETLVIQARQAALSGFDILTGQERGQ